MEKRLIDANALIDEHYEACNKDKRKKFPSWSLRLMWEAPTIDAELVVRCKDCKYYVDEGMYCAFDIIVQFEHFYCYHGERKDDE